MPAIAYRHLVVIVIAFAGVSCRGQAELRRGQELLDAGEPREAYRHFYEAYRLAPSEANEELLNSVGRIIAEAQLSSGREQIARGDFDLARSSRSEVTGVIGSVNTKVPQFQR